MNPLMKAFVPVSILLSISCLLGCGDSVSSVSGTAGQGATDTEAVDDDASSSSSTGAMECPPLELLDPGELLPDGTTLEAFTQTWGGAYQAGLDWAWAVDGVVPPQYQGVTAATLTLDVRFAQRIVEDCEEVGLEVESELAFATDDGAFDEVWTVRWAYDGETWAAALELSDLDGALDYGALGGEAAVDTLTVDLYLRPSGALAGLVYAQGMGASAVFVDGLAAIGGVHSVSECIGFDGFGPSCAPAGCAAVEATPVADTCDCLTPQVLCFGQEPEPAEPGLFWREGDDGPAVFEVSAVLPSDQGWTACSPGDAPACACADGCG